MPLGRNLFSMLTVLVALAAPLPLPVFAPPIPWALNFASPGDFCIVGDLNGDGYADLIRVHPAGNSFIDIALNRDGMKSLVPQRAVSDWGKDCLDACAGDVDGKKQTSVVGIYGGDSLRLATDFNDNRFKDIAEWVKLPSKLAMPHVAFLDGQVIAWSEKSGQGYQIGADHVPKELKLPARVTHIQQVTAGVGHAALLSYADGSLRLASTLAEKPSDVLGKCDKGRFPAVAHGWIFVDQPAGKAPVFVRKRLTSPYPVASESWAEGDMDHDGDSDLVEFRFGSEAHTGSNVLLHRRIMPKETDSDHDGLTNDEEIALGTDPTNPDTDGDGLLDGWEVKGFRGLDLPGMGCNPKKVDLICLVSRFSQTKKEMVDATFKNIQGYYESLGWTLHPVWIDEMKEAAQKNPWWVNRDLNIPSKWRGVVHFMQISPFGGGQADQLGDGGGCGGNDWALYATFIHEFGHQMGLSHEGFYPASWCPTYPSMMNYAYSYTYEGDIKKIRYSDGSLKDYILHETDLDETIPLPYEKVKFLASAPYHYRLKKNLETTLIDWNWNGVFGEKHVRADINYAYSTTAGRRDEVDHTRSAPYLFVHDKDAYVLATGSPVKPDGKTDPSVNADKPGWLIMRRLLSPYKWAEPVKIVDEGLTGDPVGISFGGEIVVAYPTAKGATVRWIKSKAEKVTANEETLIPDSLGSVVSVGVNHGRLYLFERLPDGSVRYRSLSRGHEFGAFRLLQRTDGTSVKSTLPISMAVDGDQVVLGMTEDQDKKPNRWEIRRYRVDGDKFVPVANGVVDGEREWIEGEKGNVRGSSRPTVLVDDKGRTGMRGRVLYFAQGSTSAAAPWACEYVAQSVADKTVGNGWMVKRYYDEWTQSRSAPAAAWFGGDIIYAYRWVDGSQGERDGVLHVSYNGTGVEKAPMGDFDDIGYMKSFGIRHSILYLRE